MFDVDIHTAADLAHFADRGIDPDSTQPRTRPVPCRTCGQTTMNQMGGCDAHYIERSLPVDRGDDPIDARLAADADEASDHEQVSTAP